MVRIPPVVVRIATPLRDVIAHLDFFYGESTLPAGETCFADFDLALTAGSGLRRLWRRQARFFLDGEEPFLPLPREQAAPLFEWGLNWCMAHRPLGYLTIHAATVARGDRALILPGFPGAGKSTLCASLVFIAGWRLFSDELALLDLTSGMLIPHPRPINLKNESIDLVARYPDVRLGPRYHDTRKGTVALAAPPAGSLALADQPARCHWVVFPTYSPGENGWCEPLSRAEAFALIAEQSFNHERLGARAFSVLCAMLDAAECYEIGYGSTAEALALIDEICRTA